MRLRNIMIMAAAAAIAVGSIADARGSFSSGGGGRSFSGGGFSSRSFSAPIRSFSTPSYSAPRTSSFSSGTYGRATAAPITRYSSGTYTSSYRAPTASTFGSTYRGGYGANYGRGPIINQHHYYGGGYGSGGYGLGSNPFFWMWLMDRPQPMYAAMGSPMYGQPGYMGYTGGYGPTPLAIVFNLILFAFVAWLAYLFIRWAFRRTDSTQGRGALYS